MEFKKEKKRSRNNRNKLTEKFRKTKTNLLVDSSLYI